MSQKAVTDELKRATSVDAIYPVGIVLCAKNKNPNTLSPSTKWRYIGENKTIRLAKADGSNVLTTGGADSIKLTEANYQRMDTLFQALPVIMIMVIKLLTQLVLTHIVLQE